MVEMAAKQGMGGDVPMQLDSTPLQPRRLFGPPQGTLAGVLLEIERWNVAPDRTPDYQPPPYEEEAPSDYDAPSLFENTTAE